MYNLFKSFLFFFSLLCLLSACSKSEEYTKFELFKLYDAGPDSEGLTQAEYQLLDAIARTFFSKTPQNATASQAELQAFFAQKFIEEKTPQGALMLSILPKTDEQYRTLAAHFYPAASQKNRSLWDEAMREQLIRKHHWENVSEKGVDALFYHTIHQDKHTFYDATKATTKQYEAFKNYYKEMLSEADMAILDSAWQERVDAFIAKQKQRNTDFEKATKCLEDILQKHNAKHAATLIKVKDAFKASMEHQETVYNVLTRKEYDIALNKYSMPLIQASRAYNDDTAPNAEVFLEKGIYALRVYPSTTICPMDEKRIAPYLTILRKKLMPAYRMYAAVERDLIEELDTAERMVDASNNLPLYHRPQAAFDTTTFVNMLMFCGKY